MTYYLLERLSEVPSYEKPHLRELPVKPERGFAASGSIENVTEEETETPW